jgi:plastocyanin
MDRNRRGWALVGAAIAFVFLNLGIATGCGGEGGSGDRTGPSGGTGRGEKPAAENGGTSAPDTGPAVSVDPQKAGTIRGAVRFQGEPPRRRPLQMTSDAHCAQAHREPVLSETVIVNDNGTLRNVLVYVRSGLPQGRFPAPAEPVVLDQNGCVYHPHVFGIQVGQPLRVRNSDGILHNIHMTSRLNGEWNFSQTKHGEEHDRVFRLPEVPVQFKCDVHSWMGAYGGVFAHPYFAVTGENGSFEIRNVPPGTYTLEAWHEQYGTQQKEVTVGEGATVEVEFTFHAD